MNKLQQAFENLEDTLVKSLVIKQTEIKQCNCNSR